MASLRSVCASALDALFPPRCVSCEREVAGHSIPVCAPCERLVERVTPPCCPLCARRYASGVSISCATCETDRPPFVATKAYALHGGGIASAIARLKYGGEEWLGRALSRLLREAVVESAFDVVVPVPLHVARLRERGFNQAYEIARHIDAGRPVEARAIERVRNTPRQAGLSARERRENVRGAFSARAAFVNRVRGARVLLVDDVFTTGATARECARALLRSGVAEVTVAVVTRAE